MTASNDAVRGEVPSQLLAAWRYICPSTLSTTLISLLPYLVAWRLIKNSLLPLLIRALMKFKPTMKLSTSMTDEEIQDVEARDAVLCLHETKANVSIRTLGTFPAEIWHIIC